MVIYADILLAINALTDWFLLRSCSALCRIPLRRGRMVAASLLGGVASLAIFLPSAGLAALCALLTGGLMCVIAFGWQGLGPFLRQMLSLLVLSFGYSAILYGVWFLLPPGRMYWHNGWVYFDVSPVEFVLLTLTVYGLLSAGRWVAAFFRQQEAEVIRLTVTGPAGEAAGRGLVDSGNLLREPVSGLPVIIADRMLLQEAYPAMGADALQITDSSEELARSHFRLVRFHTLNGGGWLAACRMAQVTSPDAILPPADKLYVAACPELTRRTGYDFIVPGAVVQGRKERGIHVERKNIGQNLPMDDRPVSGKGAGAVHQRSRDTAHTADGGGGSGGHGTDFRWG